MRSTGERVEKVGVDRRVRVTVRMNVRVSHTHLNDVIRFHSIRRWIRYYAVGLSLAEDIPEPHLLDLGSG